MGRLSTFMPRLAVLTVVWLLATAALAYAATLRSAGTTPAVTTTATVAPVQKVVVVPDVRHQAFVFAKGILTDAGFAWKVGGSVLGYSSNVVVSQSPAAGTRILDTGAPTITVALERSGAQTGEPENVSSLPGTPVRLATLASASVPSATKTPAAVKPAATKPAAAKAAVKTAAMKSTVKPAAKKAPSKRWPQNRPPAFVVAGARREPLDEMPLTDRAEALQRWLAKNPKPTDANVKYWLYQQAWIVAGAESGWWHGEAALHDLVTADDTVWKLWGIGARSRAQAVSAIAQVAARS